MLYNAVLSHINFFLKKEWIKYVWLEICHKVYLYEKKTSEEKKKTLHYIKFQYLRNLD